MKMLCRVFLLKIVLAALLWFILLVFAPISLLESGTVGFPTLTPRVFFRLLGMAYGSLLVGYVFRFIAMRHGKYPSGPVSFGIVSN